MTFSSHLPATSESGEMETSARSEHEGGDVSDCKDIIGHENKGEIVQGTAGTPDTTS